MADDVAWYYSTGAQDRVGPVSWAGIETAWREGTLGPAGLLWASHLAGWVPAASLLEARPPEPASAGSPGPAPGARAAFHCGLWAVITMFLCFPAGMILGIIAIVQSQKAQRLARENPGTYTKPGNAGMVMGIVGLAILPILALVGIMSAIAIPALLGQRARARDKVCVVNLRQRLGDLEGEYLRLKDANRPPQEIREDLERHLRQQASAARNPWDVASPAFSYSVAVVEGKDAEGFDAATRAGASAMGQCAYTIQFPGERQPGLLGGAVRTQNPVGGSTIVVKITTLD